MRSVPRFAGLVALGILFAAPSCSTQLVAPYSADLQMRATNMLAEVSAWEAEMGAAAGTVDADPRNPAVIGQLAKWEGEVEAMAAIEAGIDPGSASCDQVVAALTGAFTKQWPKLGQSASPSSGSSASKPPSLQCESLPGIFASMDKQLKMNIPEALDQQCKLPWVPDSFFAGQASPSQSTTPKPPGNPVAQAAALTLARQRCAALFTPESAGVGQVVAHGDLLDSLITDLAAVIYREERQAPGQ